jgi:putative sterol carrier protein
LGAEEATAVPEFPSDEWFKALADRINASEAYREAAATWEGDVAFHIEAEPDRGLPREAWGYLDLWHGECRGGGAVGPQEGSKARYVIRATYSRWRDVLADELDPVRGMIQGKLKVRGHLPTILRYVRAAMELLRCAQEVETTYPEA